MCLTPATISLIMTTISSSLSTIWFFCMCSISVPPSHNSLTMSISYCPLLGSLTISDSRYLTTFGCLPSLDHTSTSCFTILLIAESYCYWYSKYYLNLHSLKGKFLFGLLINHSVDITITTFRDQSLFLIEFSIDGIQGWRLCGLEQI